VGDLAYVSGFLTAGDLELNKQELVAEIVSRSEFGNLYHGLSNSFYVDALLQTAGVTVPQSLLISKHCLTLACGLDKMRAPQCFDSRNHIVNLR
jgi:hypothetical protein